MREKLLDLARKKRELESKLVAPARAAANQMKDAGMVRGSEPLFELIFQIDAIDQEVHDVFRGNPEQAVEAMIDMMGGRR